MLDRYIQKFITYLQIEKNSSPHTITNYKIDLKEFNDSVKDKDLEKIKHVDVRLFLARMREKNLSKRSVAIKKALGIKGPVLMDFRVEPEENVFPMVPAGQPINKMIGALA